MDIGNNYARRMRAFIGITSALLIAGPSWALPVFVNEIHYDNKGSDSGEGIEIAAPAGTDLEGWQLVFYDGKAGKPYATVDLHGRILDAGNGYGFENVIRRGIQNGAPDGLVLLDADRDLRQFLSYEGVFMATAGVAAVRISMDIGIAEATATPKGWSLQLTGSGSDYADFSWVLAEASPDGRNAGQLFTAIAQVPAPPVLPLLLTGLPLLIGWRKRG